MREAVIREGAVHERVAPPIRPASVSVLIDLARSLPASFSVLIDLARTCQCWGQVLLLYAPVYKYEIATFFLDVS
jgi:hypothetical protein